MFVYRRKRKKFFLLLLFCILASTGTNHDHVILQKQPVSIIKKLAFFSDCISAPATLKPGFKQQGTCNAENTGARKLSVTLRKDHCTRYTHKIFHAPLLRKIISSLGAQRLSLLIKRSILILSQHLGLIKNQSIRQKTGAQNIVKEIKQYQEKWLQHVQRMDTNRLPKQALQNRPNGRRNIGRPRKRWRDQLHLEGQGTG